MTPREFKQRMEMITAGDDLATIKRDGQKLICQALGEGTPAYLEGLELYMGRLEKGEGGGPRRSPEAIV